jgi:hypothetical protein
MQVTTIVLFNVHRAQVMALLPMFFGFPGFQAMVGIIDGSKVWKRQLFLVEVVECRKNVGRTFLQCRKNVLPTFLVR